MKSALLAVVVAVAAGFAWAEAKTWPAGYDIETLTAAQEPTASEEGTFGPYATERVEEAEPLTTLDTFLYMIYDAEGSLSGLSTQSPGLLLLLR